VSSAIATDGDDQPITGRGGVVGGVAPPRSLDDLEGQAGARYRTATPEAAGSPATRRRVDDDQGGQIRRSPASPRISPVSSLPPKRFFRYGRKSFKAMPSRCSTST
jgi:hypothetical protein